MKKNNSSPLVSVKKSLIHIWGGIKEWIEKKGVYPRLRVGQIYWAYLGQNIGSETFGKGKYFQRPVLIISVLFSQSAIVIPLTSKKKEGFLYHSFIDSEGTPQYALLYQLRYIDGKRIKEKISTISKQQMEEVRKKLFPILGG